MNAKGTMCPMVPHLTRGSMARICEEYRWVFLLGSGLLSLACAGTEPTLPLTADVTANQSTVNPGESITIAHPLAPGPYQVIGGLAGEPLRDPITPPRTVSGSSAPLSFPTLRGRFRLA